MDAVTLLKDDHKLFKRLLKEGDETTERAAKSRKDLLRRLTAALKAHEEIEEKILYPALKKHEKAKDIVLEGYQEHHVADLIVGELHRTAVTDEKWGAKWSVLKENIEHHIEEEEDDMFKKARQIFDRAELVELGERMAELRRHVRRAA
jgi:polyhydroxyalkanoate synthesis regulator phasin